ncbi:MAG: beta-ketoacyl-[acyl-carrier-protein] synthase family protein [Planctomycetota bacterium]|nr:beta-ketoacyl-[acyl-carrier-protein] synthase family protein [Planctomycetota bacterium]
MADLNSRRVVVTGLGAVSPLGNTTESLWEALTAGTSGIRPLTSIPTDHLTAPYGGECIDFTGNIDDFGELDKLTKRSIKKGLRVMCREIQLGVAVAQEALRNANLQMGDYNPERTGVVYGSDYIMTLPEEFLDGIQNCLDHDQQFDFDRWAENGLPKVSPLWLLKYLPNMPASHIAIYNDLQGPNNSLTMREASSNLAIAEAYCTIMRGDADIMIAGATGSRVHPLRTIHVTLQEELAGANMEPSAACRPFDKDRSGMVIGEGAGALILEELASAQERGVPILAEVIGHNSSTVIDRDGTARCGQALAHALRLALKNAGITPDQLGHVHAHGISTQEGDQQEAQAIAQELGPDALQTPVIAAKSYFGNLGAASGLIEIISSILALQENRLFPILNYQTPDPECPVAAVQEDGQPAGNNFINLNVSPQGQASALVIQAF